MKSQYNYKNAQLSSKINIPTPDCSGTPIFISDETIQYRMEKVLQEMRRLELDALMIYADVEHGGNFEYLVGFIPRFEEALLVLHSDGSAFLVLGNENYNKAKYSRIPAKAIHCPHFSLPNQPMEPAKTFSSILMETGIQKGMDVGLTGWKHFTSKVENNRDFFDIPSFIVDEVKEMVGNGGSLTNRTDLFIAGNHGVRRVGIGACHHPKNLVSRNVSHVLVRQNPGGDRHHPHRHHPQRRNPVAKYIRKSIKTILQR
ncbi:hypothetical protein GCM10008986_09280 [Salinibacillus aidingensis]|uniref:Creatinase N-terminal domain-containing protein n=1 Tax=Salinibacillus aidingensis TaxID=237684 RepID=A0ABN1AXP7_9BACI